VTASLSSFSAFTTLLELPVMSDREISQSISYQAKNYIPLPISSVTIDWVKVGEKVMPDGSKKQQVFLISVPNEQVEKYTYIFKQAGLTLQALEIESMSSARALTAGIENPMVIIDIGGRSTAIAVAQGGMLKFAGQTDFASGSLTQALSTALNIGSRRAEDLKRQSIFLGGGGERELSTIMLPIVDVIINEAKRIIASFESGYQDKVAGILLCGSGANMHGLDSYIASQIGLPAKEGDRVRPQIMFHVGRIVSFFILGGVIGAIGSAFTLNTSATFILGMIIGIVMLILGINLLDTFNWAKKLQPSMPKFIAKHAHGVSKFNHTLTPLLVGIATFFLPCGFTQSMQLYTLTTGSFLQGGLTMLAFALGTLPVLALISFSSFSIQKSSKAGIFFKTAGLIVIMFAIFNLINSLVVIGILPPIFNF
jgi:sulfite exporter TauE/SafE